MQRGIRDGRSTAPGGFRKRYGIAGLTVGIMPNIGFRRSRHRRALRLQPERISSPEKCPARPQPARFQAPNEPTVVIDGATWSLAVLKRFQPTLLMLLSLALSATFASAQPTEVTRDQITLRGKVEAVDHTARTVTIRGDRGNVVTLDVPQSVARLRPGPSRRRRDRGVLRPGERPPEAARRGRR